MSTVEVAATGEVFTDVTGALLDYYRGEANTVGGLTIDGAVYPVKADVPPPDAPADAAFDPATHTVPEVEEHLAESTPAEQERVLAGERARGEKARKTLVGDDVPEVEA